MRIIHRDMPKPKVDVTEAVERVRLSDQLYQARVELAEVKAERDKLLKRNAALEAQNAAFRSATDGLTALISAVGLSTGK